MPVDQLVGGLFRVSGCSDHSLGDLEFGTSEGVERLSILGLDMEHFAAIVR